MIYNIIDREKMYSEYVDKYAALDDNFVVYKIKKIYKESVVSRIKDDRFIVEFDIGEKDKTGYISVNYDVKGYLVNLIQITASDTYEEAVEKYAFYREIKNV